MLCDLSESKLDHGDLRCVVHSLADHIKGCVVHIVVCRISVPLKIVQWLILSQARIEVLIANQ